jgi:hypothetical protein
MEAPKKQAKEPQTTKAVKPDFESARAYYWMKQIRDIEEKGTPVKKWPRKPRKSKAEQSFFQQVDTRLSRRSYTVGVAFDANGKVIKEQS